MSTTKAQNRANVNYQNKNDRINIVFPAGTKKRIEEVIKLGNYKSVAAFIKDAVEVNLDIEEKFIKFYDNIS